MSAPEPFVHTLRVRYHECDAQGVVFNANYFAFFDITFTELWREAVGPYKESVERGVDMVVAEARARFLGGAHFDDVIELHWWIESLGNTSMTARIDLKRDGETLVEGELRYVCVQAHTTSKITIPDDIRAALARYAVTG